MKAQRRNGRVIIDLTEKEWDKLRWAFCCVQNDAQGAEDDEFITAAANITYDIQAAVQAAKATGRQDNK